MFGGEDLRTADDVYGRIGLRKLEKMLRKQTREPSDDRRALGKVWLDVSEQGFLRAHRVWLVVLGVEAPKLGSTNWIVRGLVYNATPMAFWFLECGVPYEISYNPEEQAGTKERWRIFPLGTTVGEMRDLALKLAG
jgi:hypothetical protein